MLHTTTMRAQTDTNVVTERTVQYLSMVLGMDGVTLLLSTQHEVKPKDANQGGSSSQRY